MTLAVQGKCPGCQRILRIPASWITQTLRCKHCGQIVQAKRASGPAADIPVARPAAPALAAPASGHAEGRTTAAPAFAWLPPESSSADLGAGGSADQPFSKDILSFGTGPSAVTPGHIMVPHYYRRRAGTRWKTAAIVVTVLALAALGGYTLFKAGSIIPKNQPAETPVAVGQPASPSPSVLLHNPGEFPRRGLAISVRNYWYANPVGYGEKDRGVGPIFGRLGEALHIPKDQLYELSDGGAEPLLPTKEVIQKTISDFLATCRAQDRIILLFVGHAVELGGAAYLVPMEGELKNKKTLIPLQWLYKELGKCKARQKVLLMDVCRFDPARGLERPGSGPMGAKLDAALQHPPPGVQVWSACVAGQYSYEGMIEAEDRAFIHVGFFLSELYEAVGPSQRKRVTFGIQRPEDPLPLDALVKGTGNVFGVNCGTESEVHEWLKMKQTPRLSGQEAPTGAAYDPQEPMPARLVLHQPAAPRGGAAGSEMIEAILTEAGAAVAREGSPAITVAALPVFDAKVMEAYQDDGSMTPLREAIGKANDVLKKNSQTFHEEFRGKSDDAAIKKQIFGQQKPIAKAIAVLKDALQDLQSHAGEQSKEPKRWRANYNFVVAKLEQRIAYMNEYDYILGQIRKDALPTRDPAKYSGWRLASREKLLSGSEAKDMAADAKKTFLKLARTCKGTPWEILGKREALAALGFQWQVTP